MWSRFFYIGIFVLIVAILVTHFTGISPYTMITGKLSDKQVAENMKYNDGVVVIETETEKHGFNVEVADDMQSRSLGLMKRKEMGQTEAMLFVFENESVQQFWMKNTYIPLDIIFIDATDTIVHIAKMTEPLSEKTISSVLPALKVLEINGGLSNKLKIQIGDKLVYNLKE